MPQAVVTSKEHAAKRMSDDRSSLKDYDSTLERRATFIFLLVLLMSVTTSFQKHLAPSFMVTSTGNG